MTPAQNPKLNIAEAHDLGSTFIAFSPDGTHLASGGLLGDLKIWSIPGGEMLTSHWAHPVTLVSGLAWIDDTTLISTAMDGRVVVSQTTTLADAQRSLDTGSPITSMSYTPNRQLLATGHADGTIRTFRYPELEQVATKNMENMVLSLSFDQEGQRLAASIHDHGVHLLDPQLKNAQLLSSGGRNAYSLRFSPDDRSLAAGAWFKLLFWDLTSGELEIRDTEHVGAVTSIDYSPDGKRIVSLGRHTDAHIRWSNVETGEVERRMAPLNLCGFVIRVSPNGQYIATSSDDESIRLYNLMEPYHPTLRREVSGGW